VNGSHIQILGVVPFMRDISHDERMVELNAASGKWASSEK